MSPLNLYMFSLNSWLYSNRWYRQPHSKKKSITSTGIPIENRLLNRQTGLRKFYCNNSVWYTESTFQAPNFYCWVPILSVISCSGQMWPLLCSIWLGLILVLPNKLSLGTGIILTSTHFITSQQCYIKCWQRVLDVFLRFALILLQEPMHEIWDSSHSTRMFSLRKKNINCEWRGYFQARGLERTHEGLTEVMCVYVSRRERNIWVIPIP